MTDLDHLLACWARTHINAATHHVAEWCGWSFDETLAKLTALADAGAIRPGGSHAKASTYPSGTNEGKPLHFWLRPEGARGLPFTTDPRLRVCGIIRALVTETTKLLRDNTVAVDRCVIYQGSKPLEVHRVAKREGWSLSGYRLEWLGPDPTGQAQLELPVGVALD